MLKIRMWQGPSCEHEHPSFISQAACMISFHDNHQGYHRLADYMLCTQHVLHTLIPDGEGLPRLHDPIQTVTACSYEVVRSHHFI